MRSSVSFVLSLSAFVNCALIHAQIIDRQVVDTKRDTLSNAVDCNGEIYNGVCCINGQWSGPVIASVIASDAAAVYSVDSASIAVAVSTISSNGEAWVKSNSASLNGDLSTLSNFVASNSACLQNDLSSAQTFISGLKATLSPIEATITPPPNPFGRRATVTINHSSINGALSSVQSDLSKQIASITVTVVKPTSSIIHNGINSAADAFNSAKPFLSNFADSLALVEATVVPPHVIFDKRSVTVVSQGLTCHGQATVTLSASNAASLIASATSAAKGTLFYADGSSGTPTPTATAPSTSISTGGVAMITRGPMLVAGAVALVFAAL